VTEILHTDERYLLITSAQIEKLKESGIELKGATSDSLAESKLFGFGARSIFSSSMLGALRAELSVTKNGLWKL
jgi:hypothetical protein